MKCFSSVECNGSHLLRHSVAVCLLVHILPNRVALSTHLLQKPPTNTHILRKRHWTLWCCYLERLSHGKTLSCLKQNVCIYSKHTTWDISEERNCQASIYWSILIQHNLNLSAAKPNWPCSFTYMSLYTHAMHFVACMYEYETYGFIHDMLDLWLRHSC